MPCTFSEQYGSSTPCSGNGICVNTTDVKWPQLCQCDWSYIAPSDVFEMRVDLNNQNLAMDCSTPRLAIVILSALLIAVCCVRIGYNVMAVKLSMARSHAPKKLSDLFTVPTNRILFIDIFISTPLFTAWPILKVATNQVVSTDVGVTVVMTMAVFFTTISYGDVQHQLFRALISGHLKQNRGRSDPILTLNRSLHMGISFCYGLLAVTPALVSLRVDKSLGPYDNGLLAILIVRNMGLISWQLLALVAAALTTREVEKLVKSIGDIQSQDTKAVLDFVKGDMKSIAKKNGIALIAYIVFSLPWLWPQQGIQMLLMALLASGGMMPGHTVYNTLKASTGKSSNGVPNSSSAANKSSNPGYASYNPSMNFSPNHAAQTGMKAEVTVFVSGDLSPLSAVAGSEA